MPAFGRDDDRGEANRFARRPALETGAPEALSGRIEALSDSIIVSEREPGPRGWTARSS